MKLNRLIAALLALACLSSPVLAQGVDPVARGMAASALSQPPAIAPPGASAIATKVQSQLTGYTSTGGTLSGSIYTAAAVGAAPTKHVAGKVFQFVPQTTNTGAASLVFGSLSSEAIDKAVGGSLVTLTGGELIANIPVTVFDTGSVYVAITPLSSAVTWLASAYTLTQNDFLSNRTFVFTASATLTAPCSSTLSSNGLPTIIAPGVTVTVAVTGSCAPDYIGKNAVPAGSGTTATCTQQCLLTTDAAGRFILAGT